MQGKLHTLDKKITLVLVYFFLSNIYRYLTHFEILIIFVTISYSLLLNIL